MKTSFLTIVLFLISFYAFSEEKVLYCQSEHATGILFDENINSFRTSKFELERFTLKFKEDYSILLGWDSSYMKCKKSTNKYDNATSKNTVICFPSWRTSGDSLFYNVVTKRFLGTQTSIFGYTEPKSPEETYYDTNVLYVGKCEDF